MQLKPVLLIVFASLFAFSCRKFDAGGGKSEAKQVLLVYLAADNSLSDEGLQKLDAISKNWNKEPGYEVLVYLDTRQSQSRLILLHGSGNYSVVKTYSEHNSADAQLFGRVIADVKTDYPARSYGLLFFSHATGWLPGSGISQYSSVVTYEPSRQSIRNLKLNTGGALKTASVGEDNGSVMNLTDMASAIPDNAFDFIVFEACYMAGVEIVYELRNKTSQILASSAEIISPGFTFVYPYSLESLCGSSADLSRFAQSAFDFWNMQSGVLRSSTLSVIKTEKLNDLAQWVKANVDFNKQVSLDEIQHFDRGNSRLFFDFKDFVQHTGIDGNKQQELNALLDKIVTWKRATPTFLSSGINGFEITEHSGITTYIPHSRYPTLAAPYGMLQWYKDVIAPGLPNNQ